MKRAALDIIVPPSRHWPKGERAVRLVPLLMSRACSDFVSMDPARSMDYDRLKTAVLKNYICPESFHAMDTSPDESFQELHVRLKDLFHSGCSVRRAQRKK